MAVVKTWAGGTYNLPLNREPKGTWGTDVSNFLIALASNAVSLTGGTQALAAELNLGATFGLVTPYIKSASANLAAAGVLRLANTDVIGWRNGANSADLALDVNTDRLRFGGAVIPTVSSADTLTNKGIDASTNTLSNIDNAAIKSTAGIVDTKLATISTAGKVSNSATTAASANTPSAIVARDGSGNFSAGTITATLSGNATNVSGTVGIGNGGTGQTTKGPAFDALSPNTTKGDITARDTSTNVRVAVGSDGTVLTADSASTGGIKWTTPLTNPMSAVGDMIIGGASGAATRLAPNTTTTKKFLTQTGTGAAGQAQTWGTIVGADVPEVVPGTSAGVVGVSGVKGNTTGSAIATGYVGQTITQTASGTAISSSGAATNVIGPYTVPAGIWLVSGNVYASVSAAGTLTGFACGLSTSAGGFDNFGFATVMSSGFATTAADFNVGTPPRVIVSAGATSLYLVARLTYTGTFTGNWTSTSGFTLTRIA